MQCPICGKYEFETDGDFDICPICMWENDGLQNHNPDYIGGANKYSLNQSKENYLKTGNVDKNEHQRT